MDHQPQFCYANHVQLGQATRPYLRLLDIPQPFQITSQARCEHIVLGKVTKLTQTQHDWLSQACLTMGKITEIEIPEIEFIGAEFLEEPSSSTLSALQSRAWWFYLRNVAAGEKGQGETHASDKETLNWLSIKVPEAEWRRHPSRKVPTRTVERVAQAAMTQNVDHAPHYSAQIFYDGPDCSLLWQVLVGENINRAVSRFCELSGLSSYDLTTAEPELFRILLDLYEPIALHALTALLALQVVAHRLHKEEIISHIAWLDPNWMFTVQRRKKPDFPTQLNILLEEAGFQRLAACLHHEATANRLALYGLSKYDLFTATGKPAVWPPDKNRSDDVNTDELACPIGLMPQSRKHCSKTATTVSLAEVAKAWLRDQTNGTI